MFNFLFYGSAVVVGMLFAVLIITIMERWDDHRNLDCECIGTARCVDHFLEELESDEI